MFLEKLEMPVNQCCLCLADLKSSRQGRTYLLECDFTVRLWLSFSCLPPLSLLLFSYMWNPGNRSIKPFSYALSTLFWCPNYGLEKPRGPSFAAVVEFSHPLNTVHFNTLTTLLQFLVPPMKRFILTPTAGTSEASDVAFLKGNFTNFTQQSLFTIPVLYCSICGTELDKGQCDESKFPKK